MSERSSPEPYLLYQYRACPFCARVRRFLELRGIDIPSRDTLRDPTAFRELLQGGGRTTVPCLRILRDDGGFEWMFESVDIIDYLDRAFPA